MPNSRYEREIEEILRNMERTEPKPTFRERLNMRKRAQVKRPEPMRPRPAPPAFRLNLSTSEWCFAVGILLGLVAAAIAYLTYVSTSLPGGTLFTGILAVIAFVCLLLGIILPWRESKRPLSTGRWGDQTPARRRRRLRPFHALVTRWKIMRLKMRYWRHRGD